MTNTAQSLKVLVWASLTEGQRAIVALQFVTFHRWERSGTGYVYSASIYISTILNWCFWAIPTSCHCFKNQQTNIQTPQPLHITYLLLLQALGTDWCPNCPCLKLSLLYPLQEQCRQQVITCKLMFASIKYTQRDREEEQKQENKPNMHEHAGT